MDYLVQSSLVRCNVRRDDGAAWFEFAENGRVPDSSPQPVVSWLKMAAIARSAIAKRGVEISVVL